MTISAETHPSATPAISFKTTAHFEEDTYYWNTMLDAGEQDHWFWGQRLSYNASGLDSSRDYTFTLPNLASSPTATIRVQLKGYTSLDHLSSVLLNGTSVITESWSGQSIFTHTEVVSGSLLNRGENVLTVRANDSGAVVDQFLINWFEINYAASYTAVDDQILFGVPAAGTYSVTVSDFTTDSVRLFDVTETRLPVLVNQLTDHGSLSFSRVVTQGTHFFASAVQTTPKITLDRSSNWKDNGNSADWIIIAYADFITDAHRLAGHRQSEGLQTAVVDIQDVYDEFNGGFFSPEAIRDFLAYTYANWQTPAPTYVVLLGDGSQDYKDRFASGTPNFVPPKMISTRDFGHTPSDHWFVALAGDDIYEDMFIGRLSAETVTHSAAIVNNIIAYETRPAPRNQRALFVADDGETVFETNSELLIDILPDYFNVDRIYARTYTTPTMTRDITETMRSGATFINYAGHGNYSRWGSYRPENKTLPILYEFHSDVLANSQINPVVTVADCNNGLFSLPRAMILGRYDETLGESFQRQPNGGAIAVWADAGYGYTSAQRVLLGAFYQALFANQTTTLGSATKVAKNALYASSTFWEQSVRTMILLGDPATRLEIGELHELWVPVIGR